MMVLQTSLNLLEAFIAAARFAKRSSGRNPRMLLGKSVRMGQSDIPRDQQPDMIDV